MRAHGRKLAGRNTQHGRHEPEDKYNDFSLHENVTPEQNCALISEFCGAARRNGRSRVCFYLHRIICRAMMPLKINLHRMMLFGINKVKGSYGGVCPDYRLFVARESARFAHT